MRKPALLGSFGGELKLADLDLGGAAAEGLDIEAVGGEGDHLVIVEVDHLPGMSHQC